MKATVLALIAAAALSACAVHRHVPQQCPCAPEQAHLNPQITVRSDQVAVSPDPIILERGERGRRIFWRLTQQDLTFPENGIVIDGKVHRGESGITPSDFASQPKDAKLVVRPQDEIVDCRRDDAQTFSCVNNSKGAGVFRYTIRVLNRGKLIQSDPTIMTG